MHNNVNFDSSFYQNDEVQTADLEFSIRLLRNKVDVTPDDHPDIAVYLVDLGMLLDRLYNLTGEIKYLDEAIQMVQRAIEISPDHPDLMDSLGCLEIMLGRRYQRLGTMGDLEEAVNVSYHALHISSPSDNPDFAALQNKLGVNLGRLYDRTQDMDYLEDAIEAFRQAVEFTPGNCPNLTAFRRNLGNMLKVQYERTSNIENLDEAIQMYQWVVDNTPNRPDLLRLGGMHRHRFERTVQMGDLDTAIQVFKQAVDLSPNNHPDHALFLGEMGSLFRRRYEYSDDIEDLRKSIRLSQQAAKEPIDRYPYLIPYLAILGIMLGRRYERLGNPKDIDKAIHVSRRALNLIPKEHEGLVTCLTGLGNNLEIRYKQKGNEVDINEAIKVSHQAVEEAVGSDPRLASLLNNLGNKLQSQYERTGNTKSLEDAIQLSYKAVNLVPDTHPGLALCLIKLGMKLESRFNYTGKLKDLEEVIEVYYKAVRVVKAAIIAKALLTARPNLGHILYNLGIKLEIRYRHTGSLEDLAEAEKIFRPVVDGSTGSNLDPAGRLYNLAIILGHQYQRTEKIEYLEEAIESSRKAIDITPKDHLDIRARLNVLAINLKIRFLRTGSIKDLGEAIQISRRVIEDTPSDHPGIIDHRNNLSIYLERNFEETREINSLDEAIQLSRDLVDTTSSNNPNYAAFLNNLGSKLYSRYKCTQDIEDLNDAIRLSRKAVELMPKSHPDRAGCLINLGNQLLRLDPSNTTEVLDLLMKVWNHHTAIPFIRIHASILALPLLQSRMQYEEAYQLATQTIDLLPRVHNRSLSRGDQQHVVSRFSGLASSGCSLALQIGESAEKAMEYLERGRGVILGLLIDSRSDISALKAEYPDLCAEYERLHADINSIDSTTNQRPHESAHRRSKGIEELDNCINTIRKLPGFDRFQRGLTPNQMQTCARDGYIVTINITDLRSDAIIISAYAFRTIPLPNLSSSQAKSWIEKDLTCTNKNKVYFQFLSWLWQGCAKPVIDMLQHHAQSSVLPRIWWIGAGLASSFPFHAAGDGSVGSMEWVCYRAISSYTPSIKTLMYSIESVPQREAPRNPKVLIVTMDKTPGADDLPGANEEEKEVKASVGNFISVQAIDKPDAALVMQHLTQCNIAHFACHGVSNAVDPSNSGLLLQASPTGQQQGAKQDLLSVQKISQMRLSHAEIAYLSACSTAENLSRNLADEALHIVSGFQVAGFRHVLGCLWPSSDRVCVQVAKYFYSNLLKGGAGEYNDRDIAVAMHKAVLQIRSSAEYCKRPLLWAQYVHFGA
ncbi:hypothetical protein FQN57_004572 [Myotisia sp. PD_48]|nr:hypothetical protein FQN57_004572 [Myotisia sp. PD_48]